VMQSVVWSEPHVIADQDDRQDLTEAALDDLRMVERAKSDPAQFAALFERYHQAIYVYCYRRLGTPESSDDAASTVFIKAFTALPGFRPDMARSGSTFRSWLFSIARNVVIDVWRRDRHHLSIDASVDDSLSSHLVDPMSSPEDLALGGEEARKVIALLAQLPERQRAAVELRLAGLSASEVASALGLSLSATKSMQFRAYRALRDLLRANPHAITREIPQ
jgi:RNA polymerase sigma-70 factor (ECF subfamily)